MILLNGLILQIIRSPKGDIPLNVNKKVIGKFKDETGDKELSHFVALRAKLYSYYCNNDVK